MIQMLTRAARVLRFASMAALVLGLLVATATAEQWDRPNDLSNRTWNNKNQPQSNRESDNWVNRDKNSANRNNNSGNSNNNLTNPKNWKKGATGILGSPF